jgi:dUTPase
MREYSENGDSGVDVRFPEDVTIQAGESQLVFLGIRVWCELKGLSVPFQLIPRSSIGKTSLLAEEEHSPIIGASCTLQGLNYKPLGYSESMDVINPVELSVNLSNHGDKDVILAKGTAMFQLVECTLSEPAKVLAAEWRPPPPGHREPVERVVEFLLQPVDGDSPAVCGATILTRKEWRVPPQTTIEIGLGVRACCLVDGEPQAFLLLAFLEQEKTPDAKRASAETYTMPLVMKNWVGLIDKGYRGELKAKLFNEWYKEYVIPKGIPLFGMLSAFGSPRAVRLVGTDEPQFLPGATLRAGGGFGSTGAGGKA